MVAGFWRVEGLGSSRGPYKKQKKRAGPKQGLTREQQRLVMLYMPMARAWANPFRRHWSWTQEDFLSAAYIALVESAIHFDPSRGVKFGSFARLRIRGALLDVQASLRHTYQTDGRHSLATRESPLDSEESGILLTTYDDRVGHDLEARDFVEDCLRRLPPRHAKACKEIYLNGRSQKDAAKLVGCSKSKLSVIHREAMDLLRESWETRVAGLERRELNMP